MGDAPYQELRFGFESARFRLGSSSLSPLLSPFTRRLSIGGVEPSSRRRRSAPAAARQLSWMSLQGWLVDAEEATSARAIKGGLKPEQAVAWELFSPIQRVLFIAIISVAAAESRKNRLISQLKKSVEFRDQVLSNMQHKLDSLCEQMNNIKDHSTTRSRDASPTTNVVLASNEDFGCDKIKFVDCGCWLCDQHHDLSHGLVSNNNMKGSNGDEILQYKMSFENVAEQEERRMSDLSDMASSVTSAADIQLNSLAIEQDIYNLRRDCEEKDGTIQELTSLLHSSETAGLKRIAELADIIRRKNSTITRLKKDMAVLEQKVVHHTRLRRPSYSSLSLDDGEFTDPLPQIPHMAENLLYDMDNTTSPSSSDSDSSSPVNRAHASVPEIAKNLQSPPLIFESALTSQKSVPEKALTSMLEQQTGRRTKPQSMAPLKEITMNSRRLRSVNTKSQPVSPRSQPTRPLSPLSKRSQPASPGSRPASPLSPLSRRSQPASSGSRPASPLSSLPKKSQPASSIKKPSTAQSSRPRQLSTGGDSKVSKRHFLSLQTEPKDATPQKRWA